MLLRQTITTTRGRHNHLLSTTARLSQRHDAARSTTRAGVTANIIIINRRQNYSSLLFWRNSNSLISAPPPAVLVAKASSCSSSLQQQQRQYYGKQSNDYYKSTNQAAFTTTAAFLTAAMATAAAASSRNDDDSTIAFNSTQFCSSNNISGKNICHCEAATTNKESQSAKLTATSSTTPYNNEDDNEQDNLPTYTMSQVANFNGQLSPSNPNKRIWMSYGGLVYDVTEFVANHPGGSEKILMGAGGAIEPYWYCEFVLIDGLT